MNVYFMHTDLLLFSSIVHQPITSSVACYCSVHVCVLYVCAHMHAFVYVNVINRRICRPLGLMQWGAMHNV